MAPVNLPYLHIVTARGRQYAYYRRGVLRARIPGEIGALEWLAAYQSMHEQAEAKAATVTAPTPVISGSFRALWLAYRQSAEWSALRQITQEGYTRLIEPLLPRWGQMPVAQLPPEWVQRRMDEMTPARANHFLAVLKLLLNWSIPRGWLKINPAAHISRTKHKPQSHRIWADAEIAAMTGQDAGLVALPVLLALYTGQRLGDVLRLPWSAYDGQTITIAAQGKTGARVVVPVLPELRTALNSEERRAVTICARQDGHAWKIDHFKHVFAGTRAKLGLTDDLHFHGLRHSAAVQLAEAGCTPHEIAAVTGHRSLSMVSRYTAQVQQEALAAAAMAKLEERSRPRE